MEEESQLRRSTKLSRSRNRQVLRSSRRRPGMEEEERGPENSGSVQEGSPLPPKKPDLKEGSDNPGQGGLLKPDEDDDFQPHIRRSSASVGKMQRPRVTTRPKVMTRPQTRSRQSGEDEKENKPENVAEVKKSVVIPPKETEKLKDDKTDSTPSITVDPVDEDLQPFMRRTSATVDKNARPRVMTRPKVVPRPQVRSRRSRDVPVGEEQVEQYSHDPPPPIDVTSDVHMQDQDEANNMSTLGSQDTILSVSTPVLPRVNPVQTAFEEDSNLSTSVVKSVGVDVVEQTIHPAMIDQSATNFQHDVSNSNTPMEGMYGLCVCFVVVLCLHNFACECTCAIMCVYQSTFTCLCWYTYVHVSNTFVHEPLPLTYIFAHYIFTYTFVKLYVCVFSL